MADPRQVQKDFSIMGSTLKPLGNINASTMIGRLKGGQVLALKRQPDNQHDKNAIIVMYGPYALGYVPRGLAAQIAPLMDDGVKVIVRKAMNALYGVCQLAYLAPAPKPAAPDNWVITRAYDHGSSAVPLVQMPEGVTQEDLDTATDLPPLGDSRRPRAEAEPLYNDPDSVSAETPTEEVPNVPDEPKSDAPEVA